MFAAAMCNGVNPRSSGAIALAPAFKSASINWLAFVVKNCKMQNRASVLLFSGVNVRVVFDLRNDVTYISRCPERSVTNRPFLAR